MYRGTTKKVSITEHELPLDEDMIRLLFMRRFQNIPIEYHSSFPEIRVRVCAATNTFVKYQKNTSIQQGAVITFVDIPKEVTGSRSPSICLENPGSKVDQLDFPKEFNILKSSLEGLRATSMKFRQGSQRVLHRHAICTQNPIAFRAKLSRPFKGSQGIKHQNATLVELNELHDLGKDVWETAEQLRIDMIQRGSIPSQATLDWINEEIRMITPSLRSKSIHVIDFNLRAAKYIWQHEVKRIVEEQERFSILDSKLKSASYSLNHVAQVLSCFDEMKDGTLPGLSSEERFSHALVSLKRLDPCLLESGKRSSLDSSQFAQLEESANENTRDCDPNLTSPAPAG
jgi:hypothetical protein